MKSNREGLRVGELVEVKTPDEILVTLDADGAHDHLPFMPEMVEFCGKRFSVTRRAVKVCFTGPKSAPRRFRNNDVVLLDSVRCSGASHDGCQKACAILWREAWLRRVTADTPSARVASGAGQRLRDSLKTRTDSTHYFCQASELLKATEHLSKVERYRTCVTDVLEHNCSPWEMTRRIQTFAFWKARRLLFGEVHQGARNKTPAGGIGLKPGEPVEVKPVREILLTLNPKAHNHGLYFMPGMRAMCGKQSKVESRIERIIVDGTGEMRELHDTVRLQGSVCDCTYQAVGGCSRCEISYWRELWLRRSTNGNGQRVEGGQRVED